jgi:hypothetical protein
MFLLPVLLVYLVSTPDSESGELGSTPRENIFHSRNRLNGLLVYLEELLVPNQ